jgi:hypothetical protein
MPNLLNRSDCELLAISKKVQNNWQKQIEATGVFKKDYRENVISGFIPKLKNSVEKLMETRGGRIVSLNDLMEQIKQ